MWKSLQGKNEITSVASAISKALVLCPPVLFLENLVQVLHMCACPYWSQWRIAPRVWQRGRAFGLRTSAERVETLAHTASLNMRNTLIALAIV